MPGLFNTASTGPSSEKGVYSRAEYRREVEFVAEYCILRIPSSSFESTLSSNFALAEMFGRWRKRVLKDFLTSYCSSSCKIIILNRFLVLQVGLKIVYADLNYKYIEYIVNVRVKSNCEVSLNIPFTWFRLWSTYSINEKYSPPLYDTWTCFISRPVNIIICSFVILYILFLVVLSLPE